MYLIIIMQEDLCFITHVYRSPPIRGHGFSVGAKCGEDLADPVENYEQSGQDI